MAGRRGLQRNEDFFTKGGGARGGAQDNDAKVKRAFQRCAEVRAATKQITPKQITFIASFGGPGGLSAPGGGFPGGNSSGKPLLLLQSTWGDRIVPICPSFWCDLGESLTQCFGGNRRKLESSGVYFCRARGTPSDLTHLTHPTPLGLYRAL